jgi:hypothetical protein
VDERKRRIGKNEALFRQVNERLEEMNTALEELTDVMVLVCECGDLECSEQIEMPHSEYEQLRSDPKLFAVRPGHEAAGVEEVVRRAAGYDVVRKAAGLPTQLAEETHPRS